MIAYPQSSSNRILIASQIRKHKTYHKTYPQPEKGKKLHDFQVLLPH
jgi:hypothetical protein